MLVQNYTNWQQLRRSKQNLAVKTDMTKKWVYLTKHVTPGTLAVHGSSKHKFTLDYLSVLTTLSSINLTALLHNIIDLQHRRPPLITPYILNSKR